MSAEQVTIDLKGACILCYQPVATGSNGRGASDHQFQILCQILNLNPSIDRYVFPNLPEEIVQETNWNVRAATCQSCSNKIQDLVSHLQQTQIGLQTIYNDLTQCNQNAQLVQNAYGLVRQTESQLQFPFVQHLRSAVIAKIQEENPLKIPQMALPPTDERRAGDMQDMAMDRGNDGNDSNDEHNDEERSENERDDEQRNDGQQRNVGDQRRGNEQTGDDGSSGEEYFSGFSDDDAIGIRIIAIRSLGWEQT